MDDYRGNSFVNLATIVIFLFGFSFLLNSGIKPPLLVVDSARFYRSCEK